MRSGDVVVDSELNKIYMVIDILKERRLAKVQDGNSSRTVPLSRLEPL